MYKFNLLDVEGCINNSLGQPRIQLPILSCHIEGPLESHIYHIRTVKRIIARYLMSQFFRI